MGGYGGIKEVLDLEACLDLATAGKNRRTALFEAANERRIAVTYEVWKEVKKFDGSFASAIKASAIEIVECDEKIYQTVEMLASMLSVSPGNLDLAAHDKLRILALVACAQDGTLPKCVLVTGDPGTHKSSMRTLATALKIKALDVSDAF